MKIKVIGCGNAFSKKSYNQSFLIEENGRQMLVDCGQTVPLALESAGIKLKDINDIYISHQHADHIGGLEEVAFTRYDWAKRPHHWKEGSYAPRLIAEEGLMKDLWDQSLRGGLQSMEGFDSDLNTFFECAPVKSGEAFDFEGWQMRLTQQIHIMAGSRIMPTYGLVITKEGHKTMYLTTDSQHCSPKQMQVFYKQADIIIQDCEITGNNFKFMEGQKYYEDTQGQIKAVPSYPDVTDDSMLAPHQTWKVFQFGSGVHANYGELAGFNSANAIKLPAEIKAKMWLSHYQDFKMAGKDMFGNSVDWDTQAKLDGFAGFVSLGQVFEV